MHATRLVLVPLSVMVLAACGADYGAVGDESDSVEQGSTSSPVTIYPAITTVLQTTRVPFSCDVVGGGTCSYAVVSGVGSVSSSGIYTAPAGGGTAVVRATSGANHADAKVTVAGSLPSIGGDCAKGGPYPHEDTTLNQCTMVHREFVGTATRKYDVMIPLNYRPGQSGLLIHLGDTGHGISNWCNPTSAGNETGGWGPYLRSVPSPAPVLVCVEGAFTTHTTMPEHFNMWGGGNAGWVNGIVPNDPDFVRQVILSVVKDLDLDPKKVYLSHDWFFNPTSQSAILNSDLVAAVGTWADPIFWNSNSNFTVISGTYAGTKIPKPAVPISMITLASHLGLNAGAAVRGICGVNDGTHPLTTDDQFDLFASADGITSSNIAYGPKGGATTFCDKTYNGNGVGNTTGLEMKRGSHGKLGTEVAVYQFMGNTSRATPFCSFDWNGRNTYCTAASGPPLDLRNTACNQQTPCNHYVDATTGYDPKGLTYKFFLAHPKP